MNNLPQVNYHCHVFRNWIDLCWIWVYSKNHASCFIHLEQLQLSFQTPKVYKVNFVLYSAKITFFCFGFDIILCSCKNYLLFMHEMQRTHSNYWIGINQYQCFFNCRDRSKSIYVYVFSYFRCNCTDFLAVAFCCDLSSNFCKPVHPSARPLRFYKIFSIFTIIHPSVRVFFLFRLTESLLIICFIIILDHGSRSSNSVCSKFVK